MFSVLTFILAFVPRRLTTSLSVQNPPCPPPGRWETFSQRPLGFPGFPEQRFERNGIGQPPGSALAARCSPWAAGGGRAPPLLLPGRYMPLVQGLRTPRKLLALAQKAHGERRLRPRAGAAGARYRAPYAAFLPMQGVCVWKHRGACQPSPAVVLERQ